MLATAEDGRTHYSTQPPYADVLYIPRPCLPGCNDMHFDHKS